MPKAAEGVEWQKDAFILQQEANTSCACRDVEGSMRGFTARLSLTIRGGESPQKRGEEHHARDPVQGAQTLARRWSASGVLHARRKQGMDDMRTAMAAVDGNGHLEPERRRKRPSCCKTEAEFNFRQGQD